MEPDFEDAAKRVVRALGDAATVAVGLGVLGVNRLQVIRRHIEAQFSEDSGSETGSGTDSGSE